MILEPLQFQKAFVFTHDHPKCFQHYTKHKSTIFTPFLPSFIKKSIELENCQYDDNTRTSQ